MNKVEKVSSCLDQGFTCSQVIPLTYGPELGLDRETALKISAALERVCHGREIFVGRLAVLF